MGGRISLKAKELILTKFERIGMPIAVCKSVQIRKIEL